VAAVLDHRHHDTALGTFLRPYRALCEHGDGRARPTIYTVGTKTGRMSCVRPNLQQLSREGGVRACLTADPGQILISADFSGVEIRVAAALSGDPTLAQLIRDGRDLHGEVARQAFGPDAGKAQRYVAKRIVFGRLYGGGIATLARQGGVSEQVATAVVASLDALTPQLSAWSRDLRTAVQNGHTHFPSYSGRIIHLPIEYPHKAPNYCIQGSARELLVDALLRWSDTKWGACTVLPVHDEIVAAVPEGDAEEATAELVRCMRSSIYGIDIEAEPSEPSFAWADST
jgi:DNA polymerase I-like protein with 3'-5' exonuclease and polymerase domains